MSEQVSRRTALKAAMGGLGLGVVPSLAAADRNCGVNGVDIRTDILWGDTKVTIYLDDGNTAELIDALEKTEQETDGADDGQRTQQFRVPFTVGIGKAAKHAKRALKGLKLADRLRASVKSSLEQNSRGCGVVLEVYMDGTRPSWVDVDPQR